MTVLFDNRLFGGGGKDTHNKGWYATPEALRTAHPTANAGDFAVVGSTDTIWVWDVEGSAWKDTDTKGQVTSVNDQTGDVKIKTVNNTSLMGTGNVTIKTYQNFPAAFTTSGTLEQVVASMMEAEGYNEAGMAYLGGISGACMPWPGGGNAECKVEYYETGMPVLTLCSSNVPPYRWEYHSYNNDYKWKKALAQMEVMPTDNLDLAVGTIVQYIGTTNATYTNGYLYKCVQNGSNYEWQRCDVQPNTSSNSEAAPFRGKTLSIMGDSISTFGYDPNRWGEGKPGYWIPQKDGTNLQHRARYPQDNLFTDVKYCWWYKLAQALEMNIGINDSWAGSRISNTSASDTGDVGPNACMASITRIKNLGSAGIPDVILFYGGTNDAGASVPVGTFDTTGDYKTVDLVSNQFSTYADALKAAIMRMRHFYPNAKIVYMLPTYCKTYYTSGTIESFNEIAKTICSYFGVIYIDLRQAGIHFANWDTYLPDEIHPNAAGADLIFKEVYRALVSNIEMEKVETIKHVNSVSMPETLELTQGQTGTLSATVLPADATNKGYFMESGALNIAEVYQGTVKAKNAGVSRITAYSNDGYKTGSTLVKVNPVTWYSDTIIYYATTDNREVNKAGRGWTNSDAINQSMVNKPVNTIRFINYGTVVNGTASISLIDITDKSTSKNPIDTVSATYSATNGELVVVKFDRALTPSAGQGIGFFCQESTNFGLVFSGSTDPSNEFYTRVPKVYGSGSIWTHMSTYSINIDAGYTSSDWKYYTRDIVTSSVALSPANVAGRGWTYSDGVNKSLVGLPINKMKFLCNGTQTNATVSMSIIDITDKTTQKDPIDTVTATFSGTDKQVIEVKFNRALTLQEGQGIAFFCQASTNFSFYYYAFQGLFSFYSRLPKVYGTGNAWTQVDYFLNIAVGYEE